MLALGAIIGGLAAGVVGGLWASTIDGIDDTFSVILGVISFIVAYFFVQLIMSVVRSYSAFLLVRLSRKVYQVCSKIPTTSSSLLLPRSAAWVRLISQPT